jgi:16S rRNA (guanine527-N7)-methyltransferase
MNQNKFIEELKKINIELSEKQINQLEKYYELLIEWNNVMNLTGITEKESVYLKHFYDSLTLAKIIDLNKVNTLCDIGSGAGFPGIVIKIVFPNLKITLVDSLNKRINFLNYVIEKLELKDIEAIHYRIEEYASIKRNYFDVVTARAVAPINTLLEYAIPVTKENGYFVAMKGKIDNEVAFNNASKLLNANLINTIKFDLPIENSERTLLLFKKQKDVKKYPRKYSEIKKRPL